MWPAEIITFTVRADARAPAVLQRLQEPNSADCNSDNGCNSSGMMERDASGRVRGQASVRLSQVSTRLRRRRGQSAEPRPRVSAGTTQVGLWGACEPSLRIAFAGGRRGRERAYLEAAVEIVWHVRPWPATPLPERRTAQPERTTQQIISRARADVAPSFGSARREARTTRSEVKTLAAWVSRDEAMVSDLVSLGAVDTCQHAQQT